MKLSYMLLLFILLGCTNRSERSKCVSIETILSGIKNPSELFYEELNGSILYLDAWVINNYNEILCSGACATDSVHCVTDYSWEIGNLNEQSLYLWEIVSFFEKDVLIYILTRPNKKETYYFATNNSGALLTYSYTYSYSVVDYSSREFSFRDDAIVVELGNDAMIELTNRTR